MSEGKILGNEIEYFKHQVSETMNYIGNQKIDKFRNVSLKIQLKDNFLARITEEMKT